MKRDETPGKEGGGVFFVMLWKLEVIGYVLVGGFFFFFWLVGFF